MSTESKHTPRVVVISESNLRASVARPRDYFEHATIIFPAGQIVNRCFDNSETDIVAETRVHAKRRVRKYDWKPLGPWLFIYGNRRLRWVEPK